MSGNSHIEELIIRYFHEEITKEELAELEVWIMASSDNKSYFFEFKQLSDASRRPIWSETEKEESWQRMYARMIKLPETSTPPVRQSSHRSWIFSGMKYVALFILALCLGWGAHLFVRSKTSEDIELVYNELQTKKGGRSNTLILSDGTKVILNAATSFRYPSHFQKGSRMVWLEGEAYFEVAKDEESPFVVKLEHQDITVLGTSFNVEAYGDDAYTVVTLLSGSVSLDAYNEVGEPMSRIFIKPNQRVISDNLSGSVTIQQSDQLLAEAWTKGKYKFKDEPLSAIARRLEKYYDVKIKIEDETLKRMNYTGTFSLDQEIQEILQVMDQEKRYTIRRNGKEIIIRKR
ncbi:FecR family protein [Parabacteroides sp. Marseille-P3160]|uniref:FecR family protein n=1 Tax=Parabacteroides sp. Marseille-P3160 TaxID=1917887 RepID=UPI0009BC2C13|nr:FecR domain-containing protein [Parabacteroides sp. Marseille-P3160]